MNQREDTSSEGGTPGSTGTLAALLERFIEMEEREAFFSIQIDGVPIWERLRFGVFRRLRAAYDMFDSPSTGGGSPPIHRKGRSALAGLLHRNPFFAGEQDLLFLGHRRRQRQQSGGWKDVYCDPLIEASGYDSLLLEPPYDGGHRNPCPTPGRYYTDGLTALAWARRKFQSSSLQLSSGDRSDLHRIKEGIAQSFGVRLPIAEQARAVLEARASLLPIFRSLLDRVQPRGVVIVVSYAGLPEVMIEVCQERGIPTMELQHGVLHPYHLGYSFPGDSATKEIFPDHLLTFGSAWDSQPGLHLPETEIHPLGFAHFERQRTSRTHLSKDRRVTILSQPSVGTRLARFACELDSDPSFDWEVLYKLHPREIEDWRERYPNLKNSSVRVLRHGLYDALATSRAQVGHTSTALYEGLGFGLETFILDVPGWEPVEALVEKGWASLVDGSEGFVRELAGKDDGGARAIEAFFRSGAQDRFDALVEEIL